MASRSCRRAFCLLLFTLIIALVFIGGVVYPILLIVVLLWMKTGIHCATQQLVIIRPQVVHHLFKHNLIHSIFIGALLQFRISRVKENFE